MYHEDGTTILQERRSPRQLFEFIELVTQAYEVKLESLFLVPSLLKILVPDQPKARGEALLAMNERIVEHCSVLARIIAELGGRCESDNHPRRTAMRPSSSEEVRFHEETSLNIISKAVEYLKQTWPTTALTSWLHEQLCTLERETRLHLDLFAELEGTTDPALVQSVRSAVPVALPA